MFTDIAYRKFITILLLILPVFIYAQSGDCYDHEQQIRTEKSKCESPINFNYFEKHGICLDSIKNIALYKNILPWIGTHYRYGGHSKKGIDCSGFVKAILDSTFSVKFIGGSASIAKEVEKVDKAQLKEGDLLFFYNRNKKRIGHIALYLGNNKFVHSACRTGVIISDLNEPWYAKRFVMAGRFEHLIPVQNNQGAHSEKLLLYK